MPLIRRLVLENSAVVGCGYFRKRTEPAVPFLDPPTTVQGYVEGTKLALCARAQTPKPKRKNIEGFTNTGQL
jgi:hypothetical protein